MRPSYLEQLTPVEIKEKSQLLNELLKSCRICPNYCKADRAGGEEGLCHSTSEVLVSSYGAHFGEEPPLVGELGSGTIFFTNCNLSCKFCQNYDISQMGHGKSISIENLAELMIKLQLKGCHNINLVTPTHFTPQIVEALEIAIDKGLEIPFVYNCGGYESVETLKLLEGIVDIYMPDIKYSDNEKARELSGIKDYWDVARGAVCEMQRQVGDLKMSKRGIAQRGLLIRHLVLPNNSAGSKKILDFIANEISKDAYVNIMDQYYPSFKASELPEIDRRITDDEFNDIINYAKKLGLKRGLEYS